MKRKKLRKLIAKAILYTFCWRNVDKYASLWAYDGNYFELRRREEKMIFTILLIIISILAIIFWHKKIDCKTSWIYAIYTITIIILYSFVAISI